MKLTDLEVYNLSIELSDQIWAIYSKMDNQIKFSTGQQIIRSADSVGANIAEGYGRYHFKEIIRFYYISRGSLYETNHWMYLLKRRGLIKQFQYWEYEGLSIKLAIKLNNLIKVSKRQIQ